MFASFKRLFFKDTEEVLATSIPEPVAFNPSTEWSTENDGSTEVNSASETTTNHRAPVAPIVEDDCIALPLDTVFARLPNSLASFVQSQGSSGFASIPARRILQELPKGSVKVSFRELRVASPPGTFAESAGHDQVLVELPLNQILMRIPPSLLSRRPDQKQIEVSDEVKDIFGQNEQPLSASQPAVSAPRFVAPAPVAAPAPIAMPQIANPAPIRVTVPPVTPIAPVAPASAPVVFRVLPDQQADATQDKLAITMSAISQGWPQMVQLEIHEANLNGATVALPMDKLEQGLRTGKLVFTWKQICEWIQPRVNYSSALESQPLDLPLNIVAPLFMAKHRSGKVQKQTFAGDLPDLFVGKAQRIQTPPPAAPVIEAAPRNTIPMSPGMARLVMSESAPVPAPAPVTALPRVDSKPLPIAPASPIAVPTDLSPQAIVKNLALDPTIAGAFVAMQDGLLVAAELPQHLKPDNFAAFLPQMFGRMNQYTKELQLGAVSSLTFIVEDVTWQIVKSGTVYLVALGKPGESLPGSKLNTLAAQLSRKIS